MDRQTRVQVLKDLLMIWGFTLDEDETYTDTRTGRSNTTYYNDGLWVTMTEALYA
jgi:hypothetical protein